MYDVLPFAVRISQEKTARKSLKEAKALETGGGVSKEPSLWDVLWFRWMMSIAFIQSSYYLHLLALVVRFFVEKRKDKLQELSCD